ncbi:MAG: DNA internalization-related competence protein ComEC/Rec2 [Rhodanobacteraceae bacterium]|nr:DNA internalization-related competence protein ComEC/Rec2 [Rhodanobacteraceae bacterium]
MRAFRLHPAHGFAFALGCCCVLPLAALPGRASILTLAVLALVLVLWTLLGSRARTALVLGASAFALAGFAFAAWTGQVRIAERLHPELEGEEIQFSGHVDGLPIRESRSVRFDFLPLVGEQSLPRRVRLSWYERDILPAPGDCLTVVARLKRPRGVVNPAGFDFERHALAQGIGATGYIVRALPSTGCSARFDIDSTRVTIASQIDAALEPGRVRATLKGLAIGDTREIEDSDWDLFRATGTTHLIAISGLHVGLAAALGAGLVWLVYWLLPGLGLRWPRPQAMALGALLTAGLYALIAGFSLPTQRTWLTIAAMLAGVLSRRELGWWTRYALALVAVLLFDPLAPLGAGFWLSFGAVAWLILAFGLSWRPQARWRLWLLPQLGLTVALLPLGLAFFQQASLAAPLVNLLAVPWVTFVVVPLLLLALLLSPLATLAAPVWQLAAWLLGAFDWLVLATADWPLTRWTLPPPSLLAWVLALVGTLWLLAPRGWPGRALGAFGLLPLLWPRTEPLPAGAYELTLLDVGQGQAALVQTRQHTLLVDTGPGFPDGGDLGDRVLAPALAQLGVRRLDRLIVSHDDLDHAGGTASLRRRIPVGRIDASAPEAIPGARACLAGERWHWDGIDFSILHPPPTLPYLGNESSCVVRIAGPGGSVLIPGDIGDVIEGRLIRERAPELDVDILIAGHHGSAGSTSAAFLTATSPGEVWYSAGYRNRFDFPRDEVRRRVAAVPAREWNTADSGALSRRLEASHVRGTVSQRTLAPRWWRE